MIGCKKVYAFNQIRALNSIKYRKYLLRVAGPCNESCGVLVREDALYCSYESFWNGSLTIDK